VTDRPATIAIDGPAASGKSTVGQRLADLLTFLYFDTGAMYRAVTFLALEQQLELADEAALGSLARETLIEIEPPAPGCEDGRQYTVRVRGQDITWDIRHHLVDLNVSQVSAHPEVRDALREQQRRIGLRGEVVMVGRDIGTVVLPEAPLKIYLDASVEERARRRHSELARRGSAGEFEELLSAMRTRDQRDSSRSAAPLRAAEDAIVVNCDRKSADEVVEQIVALWQERVPAP
jgi:CMP/dCMP kinase